MKSWAIVCVAILAMASIALMSCDPPPVQCTRLCDRVYYAEELDADMYCGGLRTSSSDTKEACRDSCHAQWDDSSEDAWDIDRCLDCISDNIGSRPCWDRVDWVIEETCWDRCGGDFDFAWDAFYDDWVVELEYVEECE
jgi:hypothetical protein